MSRSVMPVMARPASVPIALFVPLGFMPFGFFFGFDFLAEFRFFRVFGFAGFAFVVGFFSRVRFVFALFVGFNFRFVVSSREERHRCSANRQRDCVGGSGRG
jgi:hypothetical protein